MSGFDMFNLSILQVLVLDNCSLLASVSLDLPCLQNIRLVHCRKYVFTSPFALQITDSFSFFLSLSANKGLKTHYSLFCQILMFVTFRFAELSLRSLKLSSIMVSNCPLLRQINITSDSLQVCELMKPLYSFLGFFGPSLE